MKKFSRILLLFLCLTPLGAFALQDGKLNFEGDFSLGLGTITKYIGKIQTDLDGDRNYFSFNPFVRANYRTRFEFGTRAQDFNFELGLTFPDSGADPAVTVTDLWALVLLEHKFKGFRLNGGVGLYFTYTKMDGRIQTLNNGTSTQSFYTPEELQTAVNNIVVIGGDFIINKEIYTALQLSVFNIEDGLERAFSYALSLNYTFGK